MQQFTREVIEPSFQRFSALEQPEVLRLVKRFQKKQTALMVYLSAVFQREEWAEQEQDVFFTTALFLWWFLSDKTRLRKVPIKKIEEWDNALYTDLDKKSGFSDAALTDSAEAILADSRQPGLLAFVLEVLTGAEEENGLRPEATGIMFFVLRNVLDLLLEASPDSDTTANTRE